MQGQKPILLIDGKNVLYKVVLAQRANAKFGKTNQHSFTIFLRLVTKWMRMHRPMMVCICWDAKRDTIWRRKILPTYKERPVSFDDIQDNLRDAISTITDLIPYLNVKMLSRLEMEADDIIYSAVAHLHPYPVIIVSRDSDMIQIPYKFNNPASVKVFDHDKDIFQNIPEYDPVKLKALSGDTSDNINGYSGIGPKRGAALLANKEALDKFLQKNGKDIYIRNRALIDLSLCPRLGDNITYIEQQLREPTVCDISKVIQMANKYKITGLTSEIPELLYPFQHLHTNI